ncbi:hypothetical protein BY996DRAFT_3078134 [Phakopsora pachyrhizi]|nr:hypothetical protein BY996DRAFT_3078134 [Phakopsora pachyrhizi]
MEAEERDAQGILSLEPYKSMINLRISKPFLSLPSHRFSLLAISDRFGWVIAASNPDEDKSSGSGFILASKEELENILEEAEETVEFDYLKAAAFIPTSSFSANDSSTITHLSFAAYDQIIIVAISDGSVHLFLLQDIVANKSLKPLKCIQKPVKNSLSILSANPSKGGEISGVVTLVYSDGTAKMIDCYNDQTYWTASSVTAADWSPMGKRLCVGYCDGSLEYIDLGGVSKGKILPPPQVREQGLLVV